MERSISVRLLQVVPRRCSSRSTLSVSRRSWTSWLRCCDNGTSTLAAEHRFFPVGSFAGRGVFYFSPDNHMCEGVKILPCVGLKALQLGHICPAGIASGAHVAEFGVPVFAEKRPSLSPVFHDESRNSAEFTEVVCDNNQISG